MLASPWALAVIAPFAMVQLVWGQRWQRDLRTAVTFVLIGALTESFLLGTNSVSLTETRASAITNFPPLWLLGLWFCFGLSSQYSLSWLRRFTHYKVFLQVIFAGVLAPFAYIAAEKLGAITINENGLIRIAMSWGIALPLCLLMTDHEATRSVRKP